MQVLKALDGYDKDVIPMLFAILHAVAHKISSCLLELRALEADLAEKLSKVAPPKIRQEGDEDEDPKPARFEILLAKVNYFVNIP